MLRNYLLTVFRSLWKNKGFSFINIFGLTIGISASLLIVLFVRDELSYDKFHKDASNVYRIAINFINDDGSRIPDATTPAALVPAIQREVPEVEAATRLRPNWGRTYLIKYQHKIFTEEKLYMADSGFFKVFTFPFVRGAAESAFEHVNSILLTESSAKRYFGNGDPMGKVIKVDNFGEMIVTGILKDVPPNSHFHFDFLISYKILSGIINLDNSWTEYNNHTYVRLKAGASIGALVKKIQAINDRNVEKVFSEFYAQPLTSIHLHSNLKWELEPNGDQQHVKIFTIIALFIILIASINYINLTTAKASVRSKEIGVRKVIGALRKSLVQQFLVETVIVCLISAVLALAIAQLLLPLLNHLTDKRLQLISEPALVLSVVLGASILGLFAGIIPALYLSSLKPVAVFKGFVQTAGGALSLRQTLVVVQFTISIVLITGALIITRQVKFLMSARPGMNVDQVVALQNVGTLSRPEQQTFVAELSRVNGISAIAGANGMLPNRFNTTRMRLKGSDREQQLNFMDVDFNFLNVMGISMKEGRDFSPKFQSDTFTNRIPGGTLEQNIGSVIVNETALKELDITSPAIGKQLLWNRLTDTSYYLTIVGVAKNFQFTSLRTDIKPFAFLVRPNARGNVFVKLKPGQVSQTLTQLQHIWKRYSTERPFTYSFVDETFAKLYGAEKRFHKVFTIFVVIGIVIASLGLLGLATFAAQQRVKEIGIRKVLGASATSVAALLSRDFVRLILLAFVIAVPISWYASHRWLENFAFRIEVNWWVFPLAGIIALSIALSIISFQAIKAARANPVKNLRSE